MSKKEPNEPNKEILFRSLVTALQDKYEEYKKAEIKSIQATFFSNEGNFCHIAGAKEREEKKAQIKRELYHLIDRVDMMKMEERLRKNEQKKI